ncbi:MAG: hypothetical protein ACKVVT_06395 [Dehalococcoidia bacterium]
MWRAIGFGSTVAAALAFAAAGIGIGLLVASAFLAPERPGADSRAIRSATQAAERAELGRLQTQTAAARPRRTPATRTPTATATPFPSGTPTATPTTFPPRTPAPASPRP